MSGVIETADEDTPLDERNSDCGFNNKRTLDQIETMHQVVEITENFTDDDSLEIKDNGANLDKNYLTVDKLNSINDNF